MEKKKNNKLLVAVLLILAVFIAFAPLFMLKDAEFGGSDDKGNSLIEETVGGSDSGSDPWRRTSGRGGEYAVLCADRDRRRNHRISDGAFCGTEKMDEG